MQPEPWLLTPERVMEPLSHDEEEWLREFSRAMVGGRSKLRMRIPPRIREMMLACLNVDTHHRTIELGERLRGVPHGGGHLTFYTPTGPVTLRRVMGDAWRRFLARLP